MPRLNKGGLPGGRALYTGKNAYAQQGFENDTRNVPLGGLAQLRLWGSNLSLSTTSQNVIWGSYRSPTLQTPFLRNFFMLTDGATLVCNRAGTYRLTFGARSSGSLITTVTTTQVNVARSSYNSSLQIPLTTSGTLSASASLTSIVDLGQGDSLVVAAVTSTGTGTLYAGAVSGTAEVLGGTYLLLEQIDFQT